MTETSASQTVATLAEEKGESAVAWAAVRRYWKPIAGTAGVILACGVFLNKFDTLIEGQKRTSEAVTHLALEQAGMKSEIAAVVKTQETLNTHWNSLVDAAHITVTPNTPPPTPPAPARRHK